MPMLTALIRVWLLRTNEICKRSLLNLRTTTIRITLWTLLKAASSIVAVISGIFRMNRAISRSISKGLGRDNSIDCQPTCRSMEDTLKLSPASSPSPCTVELDALRTTHDDLKSA